MIRKLLYEKARYVYGGISAEVRITDINKDLYDSKYRGFLYCPNSECNAKLEYMSKRNCFRSCDKNQHIKGCDYFRNNANSDNGKTSPITDQKIANALKYRLDQFLDPEKKIVDKPDTKRNHSRKGLKKIKFCEAGKIDASLINKEHGICTGEYIKSVVFKNEPNEHIYINFVSGKIDILVDSEKIKPKLKKIAQDIDTVIKTGKRVVCMCYGEVVRKKQICGEKEFNILPENNISINYRIV